MSERRSTTALPSFGIAAIAGVAALFTLVAVRFSSQQSVWTDEATQLSGLRLGFADQLRWLAGRLPHAFAVPPDRTPPLSYWLGSLWIYAFGSSVQTARYLSVCLSLASVFVLWATARQFLEHRTALICAALLALSPNFVVMAVEIRAYAAFILFSTLLIYVYLRLLTVRPAPSTPDLWAFAIVAALCSYTHFFGVVISAGAFFCLLASYLPVASRTERLQIVRRAKWPLVFYLSSIVGLIPFISAAVKNSGGGDPVVAAALPLVGRSHDFLKLVYRLFSHQSMLGIPGLSAAVLLAGLLLVMSTAIRGSDRRAKSLLVFLLMNLALVALLGLMTRAFNAFGPTYNVWALPVVALLASASLSHVKRIVRIAGSLGIGLILAADCYAAARLATEGALYGHTRTTVVKTAIDQAGAQNVIVLYANDAPSVYFAMLYDFRGQLRQYIDRGQTLQMIGAPPGSLSPTICDLNSATLLVASDSELSAQALQSQITHPAVHTQAYYALDEYVTAHHAELASKWTLVSQSEYLAQSALALAVFKAHPVNDVPNLTPCGTS